MELESGQRKQALARLCQSVEAQLEDDADVSPALLLKARSHFSSTRDYCLSLMRLENSLQHAESAALLEYLAAGGTNEEAGSGAQGNISAALLSVDTMSQELTSRNLGRSSYRERLLQFAAKLLYYHAKHG